MCLSLMLVMCSRRHLQATSEAEFMKKLSSTETKLKKTIGYKTKARILVR